MRRIDDLSSGEVIFYGSMLATLGLAAYVAKRNYPNMTDPLRSPDWSLKIRVRQMFEGGPPKARVWGRDWDRFTDWLLADGNQLGRAFKARYERVMKTSHSGVVLWGGNHNLGLAPFLRNTTSHAENHVFSTLEQLRYATADGLTANGRFWLTAGWAAKHLAGTIPALVLTGVLTAPLRESRGY